MRQNLKLDSQKNEIRLCKNYKITNNNKVFRVKLVNCVLAYKLCTLYIHMYEASLTSVTEIVHAINQWQ